MKQTKKDKKEYFKKWYAKPENKKHMQSYMKKYANEHKDQMRLNAKNAKYNRPNKNRIREEVINLIESNKCKKILTLESKDFLFSKLIPERKVIVFEREEKEYKEMLKKKPKNVKLFFGEVSDFADLDSQVDCIYLDFCTNYPYAKETIYNLKEVIKNCHIFGVTFCLHVGKDAMDKGYEKKGDYQFDLINKLQELLGINFKVLYGEAYSDVKPMVTIVFENPKEE